MRRAEIGPQRRLAVQIEIDVIGDGPDVRRRRRQMHQRHARQVGVNDSFILVFGPILKRCGRSFWISISGRCAATSNTKVALRNSERSRIGETNAFCARSMISRRIARRPSRALRKSWMSRTSGVKTFSRSS